MSKFTAFLEQLNQFGSSLINHFDKKWGPGNHLDILFKNGIFILKSGYI